MWTTNPLPDVVKPPPPHPPFSYLQLPERRQQTSSEGSDLRALPTQPELHSEPVHLENTGQGNVLAPPPGITFPMILTVASFSMYSSGAPREARPISCGRAQHQQSTSRSRVIPFFFFPIEPVRTERSWSRQTAGRAPAARGRCPCVEEKNFSPEQLNHASPSPSSPLGTHGSGVYVGLELWRMYCVEWKTRKARPARKSRDERRPATGRSRKPVHAVGKGGGEAELR